ncbi:glutamyl-Q tRNA(Asp) synthetase [Hasllibacter halocynthiae]|uniref:Glutamyl-Q tRNA(Asp) synthetase n=1 Tax=Hasllibacter halocynthiae TaxID=595589 RepID=A0A2T0X836_9RHOB|nr:tRNA glutamyl-Q(34) synthetase GluQRS [Hasllibacter halocynthiae]PRY95108.1 glutamyl-Q tRNA(Asp) synthetase [Hasllibacter halocynthiae]
MRRTRFAPSPTGLLHLGHARSALTVQHVGHDVGAEVLLRIEDTDSTRSRPEFERALVDDLRWLGFGWSGTPRRQSDHRGGILAAVDPLAARGLIYPCSCTRRQIAEAGGTPGTDGLVYPGTCRGRRLSDRQSGDALRLDLARALDGLSPPAFEETGPLHPGRHEVDPGALIAGMGDPVLVRKGTGDPAYHLAVVHDDALQQITHVVRGADLWTATPLHVAMQTLLGLPTPIYHHHDLVRDAHGRRLAKIDGSRAIRRYREDGLSPPEVAALAGVARPPTPKQDRTPVWQAGPS